MKDHILARVILLRGPQVAVVLARGARTAAPAENAKEKKLSFSKSRTRIPQATLQNNLYGNPPRNTKVAFLWNGCAKKSPPKSIWGSGLRVEG